MNSNMKNDILRQEYFLLAENHMLEAESLEPYNAQWSSELAILYEKQAGVLFDSQVHMMTEGQELMVDRAIKAMLRSLYNRPIHWQTHIDLARLSIPTQHTLWVRNAFNYALKINPTNAWIYFSYANYLLDDMQINESMKMFRKAIELNPDYIVDFLNKCTRLSADLDIIFKGIPRTPEMMWHTAHFLENMGRLNDSTIAKLLALKNMQENTILLDQAEKLLARGKKSEAEDLFARSIKLYGSNEKAIEGLIAANYPENNDKIIPLLYEYANLLTMKELVTPEAKLRILTLVLPMVETDERFKEIYEILTANTGKLEQYDGFIPRIEYDNLMNRKKGIRKIQVYGSEFNVEIQVIPDKNRKLIFCRLYGGELETGNDFVRNPYIKLTAGSDREIVILPVIHGTLGSAGLIRAPFERYFTVASLPDDARLYFGFEFYTDTSHFERSGGPYEEQVFLQ